MPSNDKCITRMVKLSSLFHISTALNKNRPLYRVPRVHHSMCTNLSKHQDISFLILRQFLAFQNSCLFIDLQ